MIGFSDQFLPRYALVDALASQFQLTFIFSVSYGSFSGSFVNRLCVNRFECSFLPKMIVNTLDSQGQGTYQVNSDCTFKLFLADGTDIAHGVIVDGGNELYALSMTPGNAVILVAKKHNRAVRLCQFEFFQLIVKSFQANREETSSRDQGLAGVS